VHETHIRLTGAKMELDALLSELEVGTDAPPPPPPPPIPGPGNWPKAAPAASSELQGVKLKSTPRVEKVKAQPKERKASPARGIANVPDEVVDQLEEVYHDLKPDENREKKQFNWTVDEINDPASNYIKNYARNSVAGRRAGFAAEIAQRNATSTEKRCYSLITNRHEAR
jgi:hypothetical protein